MDSLGIIVQMFYYFTQARINLVLKLCVHITIAGCMLNDTDKQDTLEQISQVKIP